MESLTQLTKGELNSALTHPNFHTHAAAALTGLLSNSVVVTGLGACYEKEIIPAKLVLAAISYGVLMCNEHRNQIAASELT